MLTFNQYINEQYIDWDYVFSALLEEAEPIEFSKDPSKHSTIYKHETSIDGHTVQVSVLHNHGSNRHHTIFTVNGSTDVGETTKNMTPQTRSKILGHVGRAVKSYVTDVVKTLPGTHKVTFSPSDKDPNKEDAKQPVQRRFAERLAAATGGVDELKREKRWWDGRHEDTHNIIYDNEKASP